MAKYRLTTMGQDLARAQGKDVKPTELEVGGSSEEAKKFSQKQTSQKPSSQPSKRSADRGKSGANLQKKGRSKKMIFAIITFLVLLGLGGFLYFNYSAGAGGVLDILPQSIKGFFGFGSKSEDTLELKKPTGGEAWQKGTSEQIIWLSEGAADQKVKISLRGATSSVVASSINNTGKYTWKIPKSLKAGDYRLKLSLSESKVEDISPTSFTIEESSSNSSRYKVSKDLIKSKVSENLVLQEKSNLLQEWSRIGVDDIAIQEFKRANIVLKDLERELTPAELFSELGWDFPDSFLSFFAEDYNLLFYNQKELFTHKNKKRLVFVAKVNNPAMVAKKFLQIETELTRMLLPSFVPGIDTQLPQKASFHTNAATFSKLPIRYLNFKNPGLSIDYALAKTGERQGLLILTSSRESMYSLVDKLKSKYDLRKFSFPSYKNVNTGAIKGKLCFKGKDNIPSGWTPYALRTESDKAFRGTTVDNSYFTITGLSKGTYNVYAKAENQKGGYTQAVKCKKAGKKDCTDHSYIPVKMKKEGVIEGIEPCDWTVSASHACGTSSILASGKPINQLQPEKDQTMVCLGNSILDDCRKAKTKIKSKGSGTISTLVKRKQDKCILRYEYGPASQIPNQKQKIYANKYIECPISYLKSLDYLKNKGSFTKKPGEFAASLFFVTGLEALNPDTQCNGTVLNVGSSS